MARRFLERVLCSRGWHWWGHWRIGVDVSRLTTIVWVRRCRICRHYRLESVRQVDP